MTVQKKEIKSETGPSINDLKALAYDKIAEIEQLSRFIKQKQAQLDEINIQIRIILEAEKNKNEAGYSESI